MRRVIATIMVFLLLGATLSFSLAAVCALITTWPISVDRYLIAQPGNHAWPDAVPDRWPDSPRLLRNDGLAWTIARYSIIYNECSGDDQITRTECYLIDHYDFGWPLRALRSEVWDEFVIQRDEPTLTSLTRQYDDHPAMTVWRTGFSVDIGFGLLPIRPIWPGFLINTLFYAAVLWLIFAGPFALRRTIRRRRGCCLACGYPVGVSPRCTECGAAVGA